MNESVKAYIEKYPGEVVALYDRLRRLIFESASRRPEETLWARMPSYYAGESFVRLIPFKDHINVEAEAIARHEDELADFRITPKGMLQIYVEQDVPTDALKQIFGETLQP